MRLYCARQAHHGNVKKAGVSPSACNFIAPPNQLFQLICAVEVSGSLPSHRYLVKLDEPVPMVCGCLGFFSKSERRFDHIGRLWRANIAGLRRPVDSLVPIIFVIFVHGEVHLACAN